MTDLPDQPAEGGPATAALPPPLPGPPPFELEAQFQATLERLRSPKSRVGAGLLLVGSLAIFLLAQAGDGGSLADVAILVAVLLFHEAGHWVAMRAFGYQDVRMFFIPFFGAAVSGRRAGVAAWKEGLMLLAGPVPGIVLGLALALATPADGPAPLRTAVLTLLFVNAFNLLPLAALDGGKVLQLAIFQRHRWLEVAFLVLASLGLGGMALSLESPLLGVVAVFTLVTVPARWRILGAAQGLRASGRAFPRDAADADGPLGREVYRAAWHLAPDRPGRPHADGFFEALLDQVGRSAPSWLQAGGLLTAWLLGLVLTLAGAVALPPATGDWQEVTGPADAISLRMPGAPDVVDEPPDGPGLSGPTRTVRVSSGPASFLFVDLPLTEDATDLDTFWTGITNLTATVPKSELLSHGVEPFKGHPARVARFRIPTGVGRFVGLDHRGHRYLLYAEGPEGDPAVDRFFASVALRDAPSSPPPGR